MFIIYSDFKDAIFPFNRIAQVIFSNIPENIEGDRLQLINPKLASFKNQLTL